MIQKFRFWYEREDFYPDENFMCDVYKIEYIADNKIELNDSYIFNPYTNVAEDFYAKAKIYLMQSTGLKDKNGVEIFEGDEIELTHSDLEGETIYSKAIAKAPMDYTLEEAVALNHAHEIELTGKNIYENTELKVVAE